MSKGGRLGYAAVGLIVGLSFAFVLVQFFVTGYQPFDQAGDAVAYSASNNGPSTDERHNSPKWWQGLVERFLSAEDTLAQWIMALFSIVAVGLLWATYRSTQRMAKDTREIGEAQVAAHLSITKVGAQVEESGTVVIGLEVLNSGNSPAINCQVVCRIRYIPSGADPDGSGNAKMATKYTFPIIMGEVLPGQRREFSMGYNDVRAYTDGDRSVIVEYYAGVFGYNVFRGKVHAISGLTDFIKPAPRSELALKDHTRHIGFSFEANEDMLERGWLTVKEHFGRKDSK